MRPGRWCIASIGVLAIAPLFFSDNVLRYSESRAVDYALNVGAILARTLGSFSLTYAVCLLLALGISYRGEKYTGFAEAVVSGLRSLPSIAWLGMTVGVVGVNGLVPTVAFIFLGTFPLILSHMLHGLSRCTPEKRFVAALSSAPRKEQVRRVALPAAAVEMAQAARYGLNLSFLLAIVHDLLLRPNFGLTYILDLMAISANRGGDHVLLTIIIAAAGVGLDQFGILVRRIVRWRWVARTWS